MGYLKAILEILANLMPMIRSLIDRLKKTDEQSHLDNQKAIDDEAKKFEETGKPQ